MSQCKYCKKESYGHPFCKECGKKYFNFVPEDEYVLSKSEPVKEEKQAESEHNSSKIIYCYFEQREKKNSNNLNKTNNNNQEEKSKITKTKDQILFEKFSRGRTNLNKKVPYDGTNGFYKHSEEKKYKCSNGLMVRSYGEKLISEYFIKNKIPFEYERETKFTVYKFEKNYYYDKEKALHPDFFIKGPIRFREKTLQNVFIEFWGMDPTHIQNKYEQEMIENYYKTKNYKLDIYKKCEYTLINMYYYEIDNINERLDYKLKHFENKKINF